MWEETATGTNDGYYGQASESEITDAILKSLGIGGRQYRCDEKREARRYNTKGRTGIRAFGNG